LFGPLTKADDQMGNCGIAFHYAYRDPSCIWPASIGTVFTHLKAHFKAIEFLEEYRDRSNIDGQRPPQVIYSHH